MELKICYCAESDYLEDTICSKTEMSEKVSYDPKYDNAMYFVRDVLFKNSPKGQDYIDDYYKLSYVCKFWSRFHENHVIHTKKSFDYFSKGSSTVLLSNEDKVFIESMIIKFENKVNIIEYKEIFSKIRSDVNKLNNKKIAEIDEYFK